MTTTGFAVQPTVLSDMGLDLYALARTTTYAGDVVDEHLQAPARGGSVLQALGGEIDAIRADLGDAYAAGGPIQLRLYLAGYALRDIALDYERIDAEQAAACDALLDGTGRVSVPWFSDDPGVDDGAYRDLLTGKPEDAFEEFDAFTEISERIDWIIGFGWIGDLYEKVGLPDPLAQVRADLEGDWTQVGRCLGALRMLVSYESSLRADLGGTVEALDAAWTGNAAGACIAWVNVFGDAVSSHRNALSKQGQRIKAEALFFKSSIDTLAKAVEKVIEAVPGPGELAGLVTDPLGGLQKIAKRLATYAELVKLAFDAALSAAFGVVAAFSQVTRLFDTAFPPVPDVSRPDVDGPGRH